MTPLEKAIVRRLVEHLAKWGWRLDDRSLRWAGLKSHEHVCRAVEQIGMAWIPFTHEDGSNATVLLIEGNGEDILSDHTDLPQFNRAIDPFVDMLNDEINRGSLR